MILIAPVRTRPHSLKNCPQWSQWLDHSYCHAAQGCYATYVDKACYGNPTSKEFEDRTLTQTPYNFPSPALRIENLPHLGKSRENTRFSSCINFIKVNPTPLFGDGKKFQASHRIWRDGINISKINPRTNDCKIGFRCHYVQGYNSIRMTRTYQDMILEAAEIHAMRKSWEW